MFVTAGPVHKCRTCLSYPSVVFDCLPPSLTGFRPVRSNGHVKTNEERGRQENTRLVWLLAPRNRKDKPVSASMPGWRAFGPGTRVPSGCSIRIMLDPDVDL
jgi:hypothetical protein